MFEMDFGERYFGGMLASVTSGYGAWGPQLRLGPAPEIVVVTVRPVAGDGEAAPHPGAAEPGTGGG